MQYLRAFLFSVTFCLTTVGLCIFIAPGLLMPYRALLMYKHIWLTVVFWQIRHVIGIRFEERGRENIPDGPVIFASKHQSAWDTMVPTYVHPEVVFVLKRELTWIPFWGWYLIRLGMIAIDRSKGIASIRNIAVKARKSIEAGRPVLIYPQGTRTPSGADRPYLPGVASIYKSCNVPVVPIALNSGLFWPRRKFLKWPGIATFEYLEPIPPGLDRKTFMKTLVERIEPATARLEAEALERFPWLPPIKPDDESKSTTPELAKT